MHSIHFVYRKYLTFLQRFNNNNNQFLCNNRYRHTQFAGIYYRFVHLCRRRKVKRNVFGMSIPFERKFQKGNWTNKLNDSSISRCFCMSLCSYVRTVNWRLQTTVRNVTSNVIWLLNSFNTFCIYNLFCPLRNGRKRLCITLILTLVYDDNQSYYRWKQHGVNTIAK